MKAVVLRETGSADRLEWADVADPDPGEGEQVVRVRAAGVNYVDLLMRRGEYPQAPPLPAILGREIAGELGERRVLALSEHGGYSELAAVDERWIFDLPPGASFEQGAGFLIAFLTAYIPLTRQVRVRPGSTVLVHAATGGVGTASIQIARHLGARVVATAGTPARRAAALELGADEAYSYEEFTGAVRADVVLDSVGGEVFEQSVRVLEPLGSLVAIGSAGGWWKPIEPALLVGRNVSVVGFFLSRLMEWRPQLVREAAAELLALWTSGVIEPVIGDSFPLERAAEGHRMLEERRQRGKVVLVP